MVFWLNLRIHVETDGSPINRPVEGIQHKGVKKVAFDKVQPINHWSGGGSHGLMMSHELLLNLVEASTMQNELVKAERDHNFCHHHSGEVGLLLNQLELYLLQLFFLRWDSEFSCQKNNVGEGIFKFLFAQTLSGVS